MFEGFMESFQQLSQGNSGFLALFIVFFLAVYFLPSLVALLLRRESKGKIFLANIPAGFSWFAWLAVMAWAIKGKRESEGQLKQECLQQESMREPK